MSITVTVRFFANVELFMGKKETALTLDDSNEPTVGDVIAEISRLEGKDLEGMVTDDQGKSRGAVRVVLNDKLLYRDPLQARVKNGDRISIFPLVVGGYLGG
jgi:molybdopterin converting factor small subunit